MPTVILQPSSDEPSVVNFARSVRRPMDLAHHRPLLTPSNAALLHAVHGSERVRMWGVAPASDDGNVRRHERVTPGDIALFGTREKGVFAAGVVATTFRNKALARKIWRPDPDGTAWELITTFSAVYPVSFGLGVVNAALGYKPKANFQRYNVVRPAKSAQLYLRLRDMVAKQQPWR